MIFNGLGISKVPTHKMLFMHRGGDELKTLINIKQTHTLINHLLHYLNATHGSLSDYASYISCTAIDM